MQLHKLNETNLFNELSNEDQEVVAGGYYSEGAFPGGYYKYDSTKYIEIYKGGHVYKTDWSKGGTPVVTVD